MNLWISEIVDGLGMLVFNLGNEANPSPTPSSLLK